MKKCEDIPKLRMENINLTIDELCKWIQKELKEVNALNCGSLPEITIALAELISARAKEN
ncbi:MULTISPECIES: hypothetical protein [Eisenbergiella]|uniref:hypothetical protein n=1 Tax=Eisenbergiella TaxID=1432051 RepID=UPI0023F2E101|nr:MULTISPECIES: hypothetical protein [Eisenbergiella]MDY2652443.1 hypothetical protein [Eisenbergiella porci]